MLREILYRLYSTGNESFSERAENDFTMITDDENNDGWLFASLFVYDGENLAHI